MKTTMTVKTEDKNGKKDRFSGTKADFFEGFLVLRLGEEERKIPLADIVSIEGDEE